MIETGAEPGLHSGNPSKNVSFTSEFLIQVKQGLVPGHEIIHKFGALKYVSPFDQFKVVSSAGVYRTPIVPVSLELLSDDNTNDTAGGTGALEVTVYGLKTATSTDRSSETIVLNGTTAVALANDWWRIFQMEVTLSGAYADSVTPSHASTITLRVASAGETWALIEQESSFGFGQSEIGAFTIPADMDAYLLGHTVNVSDTNKLGNISLFYREHADDITTPFTGVMRSLLFHRNLNTNTHIYSGHKSPAIKLTGPADIGLMCVGTASMEIGVKFELLCISKN